MSFANLVFAKMPDRETHVLDWSLIIIEVDSEDLGSESWFDFDKVVWE